MSLDQEIVLAAVNAAGPVGNNPGAWRAKVRDDLVPMIAAMLREGSPLLQRAEQVVGSAVFGGELLGLELEESSTRVIVKFRSETTSKTDDEGDGTETIRTYRTDTAQGKAQYKRLQEAGIGAKLLIYKFMEEAQKGREVRVLAHFEVLSTGTRTASPPPPGPSAQAPPDDTPPSAGGADPLLARLNKLPGPKAGRVMKRYRAAGGAMPPAKAIDRASLEAMINEEEA